MAKLIFHEKRLLEHSRTNETAIAEIKVWYISKSSRYPDGVKYSLYLVKSGEVLIGFDNHAPKGHHLHLGKTQIEYKFVNNRTLIKDFWNLVKERGYEI